MVVDREVGKLPLSIGTSLAIEGLLGLHEGSPQQPSGHKGIGLLMINIRTLVRNYREAIKTEDVDRVSYQDAAMVLLSEMRVIPEIIRQNQRSIKVDFYHQAIEEIKQQFPNANFKRPKTDKQVAYETYEKFVIRFLLAECQNEKIPVQIIKRHPPSQNLITALYTHYPKDLFWKSSFERLFLLESHTGRLKTYVDWYTKLNSIKSDNQVPLNEFTLQVFGDKHLIEGQDKKIKNELKALAKIKRWNGTTSTAKVAADVRGSGSMLLRETYGRLMA